MRVDQHASADAEWRFVRSVRVPSGHTQCIQQVSAPVRTTIHMARAAGVDTCGLHASSDARVVLRCTQRGNCVQRFLPVHPTGYHTSTHDHSRGTCGWWDASAVARALSGARAYFGALGGCLRKAGTHSVSSGCLHEYTRPFTWHVRLVQTRAGYTRHMTRELYFGALKGGTVYSSSCLCIQRGITRVRTTIHMGRAASAMPPRWHAHFRVRGRTSVRSSVGPHQCVPTQDTSARAPFGERLESHLCDE